MWALFCKVQKYFKVWLLDDTMLGVRWCQHFYLHLCGTNKMGRRPWICYRMLCLIRKKVTLKPLVSPSSSCICCQKWAYLLEPKLPFFSLQIFLTSDTSGIIPSAWRLNSPYPTWQFVPGRYVQCNVSLREGTWWI